MQGDQGFENAVDAGLAAGPGLSNVPQPGDTLVGKYRVERVIGSGGMGMILAASHMELGEKFAIKLLTSQHDSATVTRFLREARASARIKSDHSVRVTDVGTLDSGTPYMVMEFLAGMDLASVLCQRGTLPIDEAVDYVLQACEAIAEAHAAGIVHRDLKPSNMFLTHRFDGSPHIKVLDFGISKSMGKELQSENARITSTNTFLGSPLYMSPEQLGNPTAVDHRTDIWSLGVVLFELVAGEPPFEAQTIPLLSAKILHGPPVALRGLRPDVPDSLECAIARCLEKDPVRRFQTIAELAVTLAPFAKPHPRLSFDQVENKPEWLDVTQPQELGAVAGAKGNTGESMVVTGRSAANPSVRTASRTVTLWVAAAAMVTVLLFALYWALHLATPPTRPTEAAGTGGAIAPTAEPAKPEVRSAVSAPLASSEAQGTEPSPGAAALGDHDSSKLKRTGGRPAASGAARPSLSAIAPASGAANQPFPAPPPNAAVPEGPMDNRK